VSEQARAARALVLTLRSLLLALDQDADLERLAVLEADRSQALENFRGVVRAPVADPDVRTQVSLARELGIALAQRLAEMKTEVRREAELMARARHAARAMQPAPRTAQLVTCRA